MNGVEGYLICNAKGEVIRRMQSLSPDNAERYAQAMLKLTTQAREVVRDLNPKVTLLMYF